MGGWQQIDKLIRKNLLLKARRPKGTCFEMTLPLVLFIILVIIRMDYESTIWYEGPMRFETRAIFPQTRRLAEVAGGSASDFGDSMADVEDSMGVMENSGANALQQQLLCNPSYTALAEDVLAPLLAANLSLPGLSGRSLAEELLLLDADAAAERVGELVRTAQEADVEELVARLEDARRGYLGSQWAAGLEASAGHIDAELALLRAELQGNGSGWTNGSMAAHSRVQEWLSDVCHLQGPLFEGWNATELAQGLAGLRELLEQWGLMDALREGRDALRSVPLLGWLDNLTDAVNGSVAMTWFDKALDELNASEVKTWLRDIRRAMDMPQPMAWLNKTLDAIDSSEIKTWLIEARGFLDSSQPMSWLNRTLDEIDVSEAKAWLARLQGALSTARPVSWFNHTLDEIDLPELRDELRAWTQRLADTVDAARPERLRRAEMASQYQQLREAPAMLRQNRTQREMIWWTSHFVKMSSPFWRALELGHEAEGLFAAGAGGVLAAARRIMAGFSEVVDRDLEIHLEEAERLASRLGDLLQEVNSSKSLRTIVYEAFEQADLNASLRAMVDSAVREADLNASLHAMVDSAVREANMDGELYEKVREVLREADFGGVVGEEALGVLRQVNLRGNVREEVNVALQQANFSGALREEMRSALRMVKANLNVSVSSEVIESILEANVSNSLRVELGDILAQANLSSCYDAQVTEVLHEARACLRDIDGHVAGWRRELDELFGNSSWSNGNVLAKMLEAVTNLTGLNATQIEGEVLPAWKEEWRTQCLKINSSKVGDLFARTRERCPFYRSRLQASAHLNLTETVRNLHSDLRQLNASNLRRGLGDLQRGLFRLNASHLESSLRRVLLRAQGAASSEAPEASADMSSSRRMARRLAEALKEEVLGNASEVSCPAVDEQSPGGMLEWLLSFGGPMADAAGVVMEPERLEEELEQEGGGNKQSKFLQRELARRKLLVAPYKGEARELWDLVMVEAVLSFTTTEHGDVSNQFLEALLRCPLIRGALANAVQVFLEDRTVGFDTEEELERFAMDRPDDVFAAVVFRSADEATGNFPSGGLDVSYAVRFHAQLMPKTTRVIRYVRHSMFGGTSEFNPYFDIGFVYLQEAVGRAAARLRAKRLAAEAENSSEIASNVFAQNATAMLRRLSVAAEQFPTPQYKVDMFIYVIAFMLPMFMIMGWIYCISLLVKEIVYEKQERLREVMRIQGLRTWVYWSSWVIFAMTQLAVLVTLMVLLLCGGGVLQYSDPVLIYFFFLVYSGAVVSFAMLISACFSRAKVAAVCGGVAYYSSYLPYSFYNRFEETASMSLKCSFCLACPSGLGVGMNLIAKWELLEEGVQWRNFGLPPPMTNTGSVPNNGFSLAHVVVMLFVDMFVYQVLAWYIEKVFPGELGLPQPWYFPFLPSYWFSRSDAAGNEQAKTDQADEKDDNPGLECYEAAPLSLVAAVQIRRLAKTFRGGKRALRGISLDMHQGTILGLLGHNGAGKSTTMSILTGLYPPSEGDVFVNGCSVRKDSCGVRKQLGICLQQNALYEALTVQEHLDLFCNLKSVPRSKVGQEVDMLVRDTGLEPKRHAPTRALSGGMKRKLSIGIALAGGSKVIALDEPTAGVDATSRRDIWQLLAAHKKDRAILLSTHFMDEADVLSDRIAIIAEGQLTAIGSSIGLKKRFADRYLLTIVASDHADGSQLMAAVRAVVPEARCVGTRGREFSYALPSSARPRFPGLFNSLQEDEARKRLGVETYGLSAATMEEVFLMASSVHEEGLRGVVRNGGEANGDNNSDDVSTASGGNNSGSRPNSASHGESRPQTPASRGQEKDSSPFSLDHELTNNSGSGPNDEASSRDETSEGNEPPPFSPQCISATEPMDEAAQVMPDASNAAKHKAAAAADCKGSLAVDCGQLQTGPALLLQQFRARLWARAKSARRDRKAWASQILLPAMFVLMALAIAWILQKDEELPALRLDTDMYIGTVSGGKSQLDEHLIPFSDSRGDALGERVFEAFDAVKGDGDVLRQLAGSHESNGTGDGTEVLRQYIMENKKALRSKAYGAVNIGGSGEVGNVTLYYDSRGAHIVPAMVHLCNNARLRMLGYGDAQTEAWNHPLPKTRQLLEQEMTGDNQVFTSLTVAVTVLLAMGFIPASFVVYLVQEKASNAKHQQLLTGVSPVMYWVSSYCWDILNVCIPVTFIFALFLIFQLETYSGPNSLAILLLLLCYGASMTPQMYCLEPLFAVPSTAYVTLIVLNIFTGTVSVLTTTVLQVYSAEMPDLVGLNNALQALFTWLLPNFCLGRGLMEVATNHYIRLAAEEFGTCPPGVDCRKDALAWDVAGRYVFALTVMSGVWLLLRLLVEWRCFLRFCSVGQEAVGPKSGKADEAVLEEASCVDAALRDPLARGTSNEGSLVISNLSKTFTRARWSGCMRRIEAMHSVRGISLAVGGGECFGLLGVNGAGKTTTMRMITGDIEVGGGDVLLSGWSVRTHRDQARRHLGYCPQFDALTDKLTAREAIFFYARIRGVAADKIPGVVEAMIKRMCLEAHQHRLCQHLSGGNKRKLSTALALIGEPDVVLLDEPSTGVDVGARRFLWDVLGEVRQRGHALVLTSHSMDECEVLCTRLTIMVSGEMRCLGTPLQLKAKYGGGYTLAVKAQQASGAAHQSEQEQKPSDDPSLSIRTFMKEQVPMARLAEENVGLFRYRLGGGGGEKAAGAGREVPLADVFAALEGAMAGGGALDACVLDYTISQTSLEEVFLYFSQL